MLKDHLLLGLPLASYPKVVYEPLKLTRESIPGTPKRRRAVAAIVLDRSLTVEE
jgi:hypothetical protein